MTTTAPNTIKWKEVLNWIRDRYLQSPRNSPFKRDWKVFNKEWCLFSSYTTEKASWYFFYNNFQFDITNTVSDHEGRFIISEHNGNDGNLYKDNFISEMHTFFNESPKCHWYRYIFDNNVLLFYLDRPLNYIYKPYICKMRISAHNLNIETGKFHNLDRMKECVVCVA